MEAEVLLLVVERRGPKYEVLSWMSSARQRGYIITSLWYGNVCSVDHEEIISHITDFFSSFYTGEEWVRPSLDNLVFNSIGEEEASWAGLGVQRR